MKKMELRVVGTFVAVFLVNILIGLGCNMLVFGRLFSVGIFTISLITACAYLGLVIVYSNKYRVIANIMIIGACIYILVESILIGCLLGWTNSKTILLAVFCVDFAVLAIIARHQAKKLIKEEA